MTARAATATEPGSGPAAPPPTAVEVAAAAGQAASPKRRARRAAFAAAALLPPAVALLGTGIAYTPLEPAAVAAADGVAEAAVAREGDRLETQLRRLVPRGSYVVIDQTHNRLRLMRGDRVVLEAPCSAGSGMVLREASGGRVWTFDTPRGAFRVQARLVNPVWRKPDWAFLEEGRPIPKDPGERFEYGVLGAYALYFGDGYLIHGTLYERLIGRPVSHGCIRVGREPLAELYRALPVGSPVYIF